MAGHKRLVVHEGQQRVKEAKIAIHDLEEKITKQVIQSGIRTDGRRNEDLREITCEAGVLPRVHGSAVFTRGETQALVTVTLGTGRNEQIIEGLGEEIINEADSK